MEKTIVVHIEFPNNGREYTVDFPDHPDFPHQPAGPPLRFIRVKHSAEAGADSHVYRVVWYTWELVGDRRWFEAARPEGTIR